MGLPCTCHFKKSRAGIQALDSWTPAFTGVTAFIYYFIDNADIDIQLSSVYDSFFMCS